MGQSKHPGNYWGDVNELLHVKLINTRIRLAATEAWLMQYHPELFKQQQELVNRAVNEYLGERIKAQNILTAELTRAYYGTTAVASAAHSPASDPETPPASA